VSRRCHNSSACCSAAELRLLAEKVETPQQFEHTHALGFELFRGYFWGRPEIVSGRHQLPSAAKYLRLVNELGHAEFDRDSAKEFVKHDQPLSQALLRYINSAQFRWVPEVEPVHRAMAMLGHDEMVRSWVMLPLITTFDGLSPKPVTTAGRGGASANCSRRRSVPITTRTTSSSQGSSRPRMQ
jgi:c-di-GMP-related signal transduction protein